MRPRRTGVPDFTDAMAMTQPNRPWTATVLTLYPEMFPGPLGQSVAGNALERGLWGLETINIRDFASDKHRTVDDTPAGGGPGMVMRADVAATALDAAKADDGRAALYLSPRGKPLRQSKVRELSQGSGAILLCGRFERRRPACDRGMRP